MNLIQKLHMLHSVWRYRLNTGKNDIRFLLGLDLKGKTVIDIGAKGVFIPIGWKKPWASLDQSRASKGCQAIPVEVITLDAYYDEFRDAAFIKCDVEGHEHDVFRGGRRLLERGKPCLLFECHHDEAKKQDQPGHRGGGTPRPSTAHHWQYPPALEAGSFARQTREVLSQQYFLLLPHWLGPCTQKRTGTLPARRMALDSLLARSRMVGW